MIQDTDMNADFHNGPDLGLGPTTPRQVTYQNGWPVPAGWKLVPEEPASRQVCYIAMEIQGVDEKGYCRFDDPRWPESVKTAERAYKAALEGAYEPPKPGCREHQMVIIREGSDEKKGTCCDPEVADLVRALNDAGIATVASCSGHGHRPGNIALADGRELIVCERYEDARKIERIFPGVNGEPPQDDPSDEEIDAIAASMPDGAGGMLKQWGYRQFARALLARYGRPAGGAQPVVPEAWKELARAALKVADSGLVAAYPLNTAAHLKGLADLILSANSSTVAPVTAQKADDARDAERYRLLRRKVCIAGGEFHILNLDPLYIGPDAAAKLDATIDAAVSKEGK